MNQRSVLQISRLARVQDALSAFPGCTSRAGLARAASALLVFLICSGWWPNSQASPDSSKHVQPVYGAGPSTRIAALFFDHFNELAQAEGTKFVVPERSTKHAGGIRASAKYLFGRTGRPLTQSEKAQGKFEIYLGRVPVGFVTGVDVQLPPLTPADVRRIFSGEVSNWSELGGPDAPVMLVGREKTEASLTVLSRHFPVLLDAEYEATLKRDHSLVNFLKSPSGRAAIGYGALANFTGLNVVELRGVSLGVELGLVVDEANREHPLVRSVREFAHSPKWREIINSSGYLPAANLD